MNRAKGTVALVVVSLSAAVGLTTYLLGKQSKTDQLDASAPGAGTQRRVLPATAARQGEAVTVRSSTNMRAAGNRRVSSAESTLMSAGGINVEAAAHLMGDDRFGAALSKLSDESRNDLEARELTQIYRGKFEASLQRIGSDVALNDLACGLSVCGMDFSGAHYDDGYFDKVLGSGQDKGAPIYSAITQIVPRPDGTFSYRIVFSTDPAADALSVPRSPPRANPGG